MGGWGKGSLVRRRGGGRDAFLKDATGRRSTGCIYNDIWLDLARFCASRIHRACARLLPEAIRRANLYISLYHFNLDGVEQKSAVCYDKY